LEREGRKERGYPSQPPGMTKEVKSHQTGRSPGVGGVVFWCVGGGVLVLGFFFGGVLLGRALGLLLAGGGWGFGVGGGGGGRLCWGSVFLCSVVGASPPPTLLGELWGSAAASWKTCRIEVGMDREKKTTGSLGGACGTGPGKNHQGAKVHHERRKRRNPLPALRKV